MSTSIAYSTAVRGGCGVRYWEVGYPPVDTEGLLVGWWNYKVRKCPGGWGDNLGL